MPLVFASEEVTLNLISAKCIPCLLYASDEALSLNSAQLKSKFFCETRTVQNIQNCFPDIISDCQEFFNFADVSELIMKCKTNFLNSL